jgi:hypothetical protein
VIVGCNNCMFPVNLHIRPRTNAWLYMYFVMLLLSNDHLDKGDFVNIFEHRINVMENTWSTKQCGVPFY